MYDHALKYHPFDVNTYFEKGRYYYLYFKGYSLKELNRFEEAIQMYDLALKINTKHHYSYYQKGVNYFLFLKYNCALGSIKKQLKYMIEHFK